MIPTTHYTRPPHLIGPQAILERYRQKPCVRRPDPGDEDDDQTPLLSRHRPSSSPSPVRGRPRQRVERRNTMPVSGSGYGAVSGSGAGAGAGAEFGSGSGGVLGSRGRSVSRGEESGARARGRRLDVTRISAAEVVAKYNHVQQHVGRWEVFLRNVIVGGSEGLVLPFAVGTALAALGDTKVVVAGGLALVGAGMVNMAVGAYGAAVIQREYWKAEYARVYFEVDTMPIFERAEVTDIMCDFGVSRFNSLGLVEQVTADKDKWTRFLMGFALHLREPRVGRRAVVSAITMGASYAVGGIIPIVPYIFMNKAGKAMLVSVAVMAVILLVFGGFRNWVAIRTHKAIRWGSLLTLIMGAMAAGTGYGIVWLAVKAGMV